MTYAKHRQIRARLGDFEIPPARQPFKTYPFDFAKPLRVLREVLMLESAEALELARSCHAYDRRPESRTISAAWGEGGEA